jgi:hypothetical protein
MNPQENGSSGSNESHSRQVFLRDAALFHGKLFVDGIRDLILFPAALVAVGVDLIKRGEPAGRYFYDVVHFGKQTEQWINLFEVVDTAPDTDSPRPSIGAPSIDQLIDDLETKLKAGYDKGEISATAKRAIDQILAATKRAIRNSTRRA